MRLTICQLKPKTPLHLGEREGWLEGSQTYIHSDTLFSAFCHAYQLLYGQEELTRLLQLFVEGQAPFLVSSAFPFWDDQFYFPLPKNQLPKEKEVKKVIFVEQRGFERLLSGDSIEDVFSSARTIPAHNQVEDKQRYPWQVETLPRVRLSRFNNHPGEAFFHFGQVVYLEGAGLFFLIELKDEVFRKKFEGTMNLLADEGIGGDRSVGKGLMEKPVFDEVEIKVPKGANGILCLSLYYPDQKEIHRLSEGYYELLERKGYIYSPHGQSLRRRSVRMFIEGSVFPSDVTKRGRLVDITPDAFGKHRIYRYGLLLDVPCQIEVKVK